jgi:hypothetical protein
MFATYAPDVFAPSSIKTFDVVIPVTRPYPSTSTVLINVAPSAPTLLLGVIVAKSIELLFTTIREVFAVTTSRLFVAVLGY